MMSVPRMPPEFLELIRIIEYAVDTEDAHYYAGRGLRSRMAGDRI